MHLFAYTEIAWSRRCLRGVLATGIVLLLLGGVVLWKKGLEPSTPSAAPSRDPRLDYAGPFQNIHPDVGYVGDARCAECHEDQAQTYHQHPMARSLLPIAAAPELPSDAAHHNPFEAWGRRYWVERRGGRVWHGQEPTGGAGDPEVQLRSEVQYAIGSGTHGYSYLTSRDGFVFLTPVSWFSSRQIWDVTPGSRFPEQTVEAECLFCHANRVPVGQGPQNYFEGPIYDGQGIGCERCHGPGERHVQNPGRRDPATGADLTIVNPRHLEPHLREAVCEQCHLQGEIRLLRRGRGLFDFRPGLPLEQFWAVYVWGRGPGEQDRAVNHVEQIYASRCSQASAGRMGCSSCHDPHVAVGPPQRVSHYRGRCLACHQEQSCGLPPAQRRQTRPDDSCIDCHMPRYAAGDIAHAAATDHRILRRPGGKASLPQLAGRVPSGSLPAVVPFYREYLDPHDSEAARDLGIALVQLTFKGKINEFAYPEAPLPLLEQAVRRDPDDVEAGEARAGLLMLQWRFEAALAAFEAVLARSPRRERSLVQAASVAQKLRRRETARRYWEQAAAVNPWMADHRQNLALLLAEEQNWEECRRQCEAWLRLDPANTDARGLWVKCLASTGRREEARRELARLERLHAPSVAELRRWLAEQAPGRPPGRGGAER
jgi:hypothetical protein